VIRFPTWVPPIYGDYKKWGWQAIGGEIEPPVLAGLVREHLEEVMEVYGGMSAYELERLSHSEDPWKNARRGIAPDEPSTATISHDDMKNFYRARLNESPKN
jgi:uncharacterized phage-associated protein